MTAASRKRSDRRAPAGAGVGRAAGEMAALRDRLAEAEATLHAIASGEVDAVVVAGKNGDRVFTLQGVDEAYRTLIESMNEGALTLTADQTILYANACFARMVKCPLEQVTGNSFRRFLSPTDRGSFRPLLRASSMTGAKFPILLRTHDGLQVPVQISVSVIAEGKSFHRTIFGLVVTDMTESRRNEELLRALTHRVVQGQEAERGRVALELHDHITQLLCAVGFRCHALVTQLSARGGPSLKEAKRLRTMLRKTAEEVERISRNLRPGALDQLGLAEILRAAGTEFEHRTGLKLEFAGDPLIERLRAEAELALFRILQEALMNVETHACARRVTVDLKQSDTAVYMAIEDDGKGFDPKHLPARRKRVIGLGLLGMRERATYVGGTLKVNSMRGAGTKIEVNIPRGFVPQSALSSFKGP